MQRDAVDPPVTSQMEPTPRGSPSSCALPPSIRDLRELVTTELEDAANRVGDIADIAEGGASLTAIASYARKCQARMLAALTQADREQKEIMRDDRQGRLDGQRHRGDEGS